MSSITFIGAGNMARAIGTLAVTAGHDVEIIGRDQAKAEALAAELGGGATTGRWGAVPAGDVVVAALLAAGVVPAVTEFGESLAGKVLVDISNPFNATADGLTHSGQTSVAAEVAAVVPASTHVVKGFNTVFGNVLAKARPSVFLAGDDADAKAAVAAFVGSLGLRPLDAGGLVMAHWLEGMGVVTVALANQGVGHWDFALGVDEFAA